MEYFLPLSVMAMIISSISIFLIDYQKPIKKTDQANDQPPSNPTDLMEEPVDEFSVAENEANLQENQTPKDASDIKKITFQPKPTKLEKDQHPFSFIWNSVHKSTIST